MSNVVLAIVSALVAQQGQAVTLSLTAARQPGGFKQFVDHYQRGYAQGSGEYAQRYALFQERVSVMEEHNSNEQRLWTAGISHLTDRTDQELASLYGWRAHGGRQHAALLSSDGVGEEREAVTSIDWNNLTIAQNKRDQGGCGSCWAVATAVMLETRHEAQLGTAREFSAQELVNCVPNPKECGGSGGCGGATVELAMKYAEQSGLGDNKMTPYLGKDQHCANHLSSSSFLGISHSRAGTNTQLSLESWHTLPQNKAMPLMLSLLDGPVAISLGADRWSSYSSGIFDGCDKDAVINHAVVLMGYGEEGSTKYWNIRNSWGIWGEDGHIRLLRRQTTAEDDAYCGWDHKPEDGIACKPYPEKQYVCGSCGMLFDSVAVKFQPA